VSRLHGSPGGTLFTLDNLPGAFIILCRPCEFPRMIRVLYAPYSLFYSLTEVSTKAMVPEENQGRHTDSIVLL
jgi:hypothetical protein